MKREASSISVESAVIRINKLIVTVFLTGVPHLNDSCGRVLVRSIGKDRRVVQQPTRPSRDASRGLWRAALTRVPTPVPSRRHEADLQIHAEQKKKYRYKVGCYSDCNIVS